jgi:hypothetical protein
MKRSAATLILCKDELRNRPASIRLSNKRLFGVKLNVSPAQLTQNCFCGAVRIGDYGLRDSFLRDGFFIIARIFSRDDLAFNHVRQAFFS